MRLMFLTRFISDDLFDFKRTPNGVSFRSGKLKSRQAKGEFLADAKNHFRRPFQNC